MPATISSAQKNATLDALTRSCEANEAIVALLRKQDKRLASIQFWTSCTGLVSLLAIVAAVLGISVWIIGMSLLMSR
jgi:hypothetical protein